MTLVLFLAAVVVVLDQITKALALAHLMPGHPVVISDTWLSLTLVMNPGLAFGPARSCRAGRRPGRDS